MEDFTSAVENPVTSMAASSGTDQEDFEDGCSICLESFSVEDPSTVTSCKHEYHLQCILEWSQRSKECPICWQLLVLKDPASQELLAAVEIERNSRSRRGSSNTSAFARIPTEDLEFDHDAPYMDDSDFDDHIMRQLAALNRAHHFSRRQRHRSSGMGPSQFLVFAAPSDGSDAQETHTIAPIESQSLGNSTSPERNFPTAGVSSEAYDQPPSSVPSSRVNTSPTIAHNIHGSFNTGNLARETQPGSPRRSRPSELLSLSESLKSKFSAASARYKESISKSTRGFKEKLLSRNSSVKELSKEVQREVTAGVTRMMERLDPSSKRSGVSGPISSGAAGGTTSYLSPNGKGVQQNIITQSPNEVDGETTAHGTSSNSPINASGTPSSVAGRVDVISVQDAL